MHPDTVQRVYLVRHGSTPANETRSFQNHETPLSETGLAQAELVAERFTRIPIEIILASTMKRAQQTAHAIQKATGVELISSDLLIEHLKPTVVQGKAHDDVEALALWAKVGPAFGTSQKHSDEENFDDLKARGKKAIELIRSRKEMHVAVVLHGTFLKMVLCLMEFGDTLTADMFIRAAHFFGMTNTAISIVDYLPGITPELPHDEKSDWHSRVINDYAHLG